MYQLNAYARAIANTTNNWTNWTAVVALPKGTNIFWAFASDFAANNSPTNTVTFVASNAFTMILGFGPAQPLPTSGLNLDLDVSLWVTGRIQVSTNLLDWMTLTNFVSTSSPLRFVDTGATNQDRRFYRGVTP